MTRELPARMSPLASLVLSVLAILACGSGGALAGFALSRALGTAGAPVTVEIDGDSIDDLRQGALLIRDALAAQPALWNVQSSFEGAPPELRFALRRAVADGLGVNLEALGAVLETSLDGLQATGKTDFAFHRAIAVATNNPYYVEVLDALGSRTIPCDVASPWGTDSVLTSCS